MRNYGRYSLLVLLASCLTPTESAISPRIVTFGDSNTDGGWDGRTLVAHSYINGEDPGPASGTNSPFTLAGMLDARGIPAVNHAISGTQSGLGRIANGSPNALERVGNFTRFDAEVLGLGYPWNGGGSHPIPRVQAYEPSKCDYAYVSMGTNDARAEHVVPNLRAMFKRWVYTGRSPKHFIVTTLAPVPVHDRRKAGIPIVNPRIRKFAREAGIHLVDIGGFTSTDGGWTWRDTLLHVGDGVHYSSVVREWIADRVSHYVLDTGCDQ